MRGCIQSKVKFAGGGFVKYFKKIVDIYIPAILRCKMCQKAVFGPQNGLYSKKEGVIFGSLIQE
jgi:hypothetical protein